MAQSVSDCRRIKRLRVLTQRHGRARHLPSRTLAYCRKDAGGSAGASPSPARPLLSSHGGRPLLPGAEDKAAQSECQKRPAHVDENERPGICLEGRECRTVEYSTNRKANQ